MMNLTVTATHLAEAIQKIDNGNKFELMSDMPGKGLPLVAWRIKDPECAYDEFAIAHHLRERGWIVVSALWKICYLYSSSATRPSRPITCMSNTFVSGHISHSAAGLLTPTM